MTCLCGFSVGKKRLFCHPRETERETDTRDGHAQAIVAVPRVVSLFHSLSGTNETKTNQATERRKKRECPRSQRLRARLFSLPVSQRSLGTSNGLGWKETSKFQSLSSPHATALSSFHSTKRTTSPVLHLSEGKIAFSPAPLVCSLRDRSTRVGLIDSGGALLPQPWSARLSDLSAPLAFVSSFEEVEEKKNQVILLVSPDVSSGRRKGQRRD